MTSPAAAVARRPTLRVREAAAFQMPVRTRMPFRYGIATVTDLPHVFVRVRLSLGDGAAEAVGIAADHLAPKWFTKDPATAFEDDADEMRRVIARAMETAAELGKCASVFDLWKGLYAAQAAWARDHDVAPLLAHFGTSLVERAVVDAFCRAAGRPFAALLRENAFGVRLGDVHAELGDAAPADLLPAAAPLPRVLARHTVGLSDPLTDADRTEEYRIDDGLPVTLEECVGVYGLRHFKLKVGADVERNIPRLERILAVIRQGRPDGEEFALSLDGNEAFATVAEFRAFWDAFAASPALRRDALPRLLFVEQPLHRSVALAPETGVAFADWPDRPPVIIDESDAETASLPTALALGYAGTSHKNCKGVFKGVANACLIAHRRKLAPGAPLVLSGEDLTNIGPVAQMQDLAVQAALGIESVERNGHHYFSGLSMFPKDVQDAVLLAHPDLYHPGLGGFATLTVADGALDLGTVNAAPGLGTGLLPDVEAFAERVHFSE